MLVISVAFSVLKCNDVSKDKNSFEWLLMQINVTLILTFHFISHPAFKPRTIDIVITKEKPNCGKRDNFEKILAFTYKLYQIFIISTSYLLKLLAKSIHVIPSGNPHFSFASLILLSSFTDIVTCID